MVPQVLTGIQLNFSGAARSRALGFYAVALSTGAVAGQVLGGVLVAANLFDLAWRPIFLINLPLGVIAVLAARRFLPVHYESGRHVGVVHGDRLQLGGDLLC
jgi:MFS family permease